MDDLALQIGQIDRVKVRQMQLTDARSREVQRHWRTETAQTDDQHTAVFEPQLTLDVDVSQQYLPTVTQQFLIIQHGKRPRLMRW
ncbi:hypothetical protein D3C86_2084020 [compost metagenome]